MPFLIDSDWIIDHLNNVAESIALLDTLATDDRLFMSAVSYMEAFQGTLRETSPGAAQAKLNRLALGLPVLGVTRLVAERGARVRESLRVAGRRTNSRAYDLLIAATAVEYDLTLVTRNVSDYIDIPDLKLYLPAQP